MSSARLRCERSIRELLPAARLPARTHANPNALSEGLRPWRTVRDAIGDLPDPVSAMSGATEDLAGVQMPDRALQQDDVDDLLASLGF